MPDAGVDQSDDGPAWVVSPSGLCRTVRASSRAVRDLVCVGHCAHFGGARFASASRPDTPRALGVVFTPVVGASLPFSHSVSLPLSLSPSFLLSLRRAPSLQPPVPRFAPVLFLPPTRSLWNISTHTESLIHTSPHARLSSSVVGLSHPLLSLPALLSLTDTPMPRRSCPRRDAVIPAREGGEERER